MLTGARAARLLRGGRFIALLAAPLLTAGCQSDGTIANRHLKPLSSKITSLMGEKGMSKADPIVVRIFKEESEAEVWKQNRSGQMALLKTYPICRWSGELGPKIKEGDRQAPEGFYNITPSQMNPTSALYLSFDLGYPNAFDRAHGRTGTHLMVHGDCSSAGCYAMTDEQISEIYALAREAFFAGQTSFQVQAYPFRMTPLNLARHRSNPNMPFWKNLKEGFDYFDVAKAEPSVSVCDKRYVFGSKSSNFSSACEGNRLSPEIAAAIGSKKRQDDLKVADLVKSGTPAAPIKINTDGGMHSIFLAKLKASQESAKEGRSSAYADDANPGTLPSNVNPPREPTPEWATGTVSPAPKP